MKNIDLIRVWKDARYRREGQTPLPENLVGVVELTEEELAIVSGGRPLPRPRPCIRRRDRYGRYYCAAR
jgi:mersacidin/lichenicidin family type 2 lantibiotic